MRDILIKDMSTDEVKGGSLPASRLEDRTVREANKTEGALLKPACAAMADDAGILSPVLDCELVESKSRELLLVILANKVVKPVKP